MKLSNTKSLTLTSASAVVFGFGVFVTQVSALETDIVSPEVSNQIQQTLGEGDSDELLVDALTQVEAQLKEANIPNHSPEASDSADVAELKSLRRRYISLLRERMQQLDGTERGEFLQRIRDRRKNVREYILELKKSRIEEKKLEKQKQTEESQAELERRRDGFKAKLEETLEARKKEAEFNKLSPQEKFQQKVLKKQERLEQKYNKSEVQLMLQEKEESEEREQVKGAIDYQPQTVFERIGYFFSRW